MNRQHVVLIQRVRGGEREGGDMYGILIKKKKINRSRATKNPSDELKVKYCFL